MAVDQSGRNQPSPAPDFPVSRQNRNVLIGRHPTNLFGLDHHGHSRPERPIGVKDRAVFEDQAPFRTRYEPSHPDADAQGFVSMPNVDVPEEMVNMLGAARAYQANLTAIGLIRDTMQRALDLGK